MNEGTIIFVLEFPHPWPPIEPKLIYKEFVNGSLMEIIGNPNGQISVKLDNEVFNSQIIDFNNAKKVIMSITWSNKKDPKITVYLNSILLKEEGEKEVLVFKSKPDDSVKTTSYQNKDSKKACEKWMSWRKERYNTQKQHPKKDRHLKNIESQFNDLENALHSLETNLKIYGKNEELLAINVLSILRALLFWPDGKSNNYNPLLFRLAGYLKLPLPIFAFEDRINQIQNNPLYKDITTLRTNNYPSIIKNYPKQVLMDFQQWLDTEIMFEGSIPNKQVFRLKDILDESANTMSAHFDDDSPQILEKLKDTTIWDRSQFIDYIVTIINVTLELGQYVLKNKNSG